MHLSQLDKKEQSFNPCQLAQIPALVLTGLWWGCLLSVTHATLSNGMRWRHLAEAFPPGVSTMSPWVSTRTRGLLCVFTQTQLYLLLWGASAWHQPSLTGVWCPRGHQAGPARGAGRKALPLPPSSCWWTVERERTCLQPQLHPDLEKDASTVLLLLLIRCRKAEEHVLAPGPADRALLGFPKPPLHARFQNETKTTTKTTHTKNKQATKQKNSLESSCQNTISLPAPSRLEKSPQIMCLSTMIG